RTVARTARNRSSRGWRRFVRAAGARRSRAAPTARHRRERPGARGADPQPGASGLGFDDAVRDPQTRGDGAEARPGSGGLRAHACARADAEIVATPARGVSPTPPAAGGPTPTARPR